MLPPITPTMKASDHPMGKWPSQLAGYQLSGMVILTPTKTSTMPSPYLSMWNLSCAPASRKYRLRRPRMAKTLLVKTMNGSLVTAKIAGTLSTAKTMSLTSIMHSATKSGVPTQRSALAPVPCGSRACSFTRNCCPWSLGVSGIHRRRSLRMGFFSGSASRSGAKMILMPVKMRNAPKMMTTALYWMSAAPIAMNTARNASAPRMP